MLIVGGTFGATMVTCVVAEVVVALLLSVATAVKL